MVAVPTTGITVPHVAQFFKNNLIERVQTARPGSLDIILCFLLLTLVTLFLKLAQTYFFSSVKSFPGPFCTKFTDSWRYVKTASGQAHLVHADLHRKYGSVVRIGPNTLSISDPSLIKTIYNTKNPWKKVCFVADEYMNLAGVTKCYRPSNSKETWPSKRRQDKTFTRNTEANRVKYRATCTLCKRLFFQMGPLSPIYSQQQMKGGTRR